MTDFDLENARLMSDHVRAGQCYEVIDQNLKRIFGQYVLVLDLQIDGNAACFHFTFLYKGKVKAFNYPLVGTLDVAFLQMTRLIS